MFEDLTNDELEVLIGYLRSPGCYEGSFDRVFEEKDDQAGKF